MGSSSGGPRSSRDLFSVYKRGGCSYVVDISKREGRNFYVSLGHAVSTTILCWEGEDGTEPL